MKIIIFLQKLSARPKGTLIPEQARLPVAFQSEAGKEPEIKNQKLETRN